MTSRLLNDLTSANNQVNDALTYTKDGSRDHWQTLSESLNRKKGDCEDYACAKFHLLTRKGYRPYLMHCHYQGEAHMVCVCEGYVLDNIKPGVWPLETRTDLSEATYTLYIDRLECAGKQLPVDNASMWADWLKRSGLYES